MSSSVCIYFPCHVAKENGRDCSKYKTCRAYKFYQEYGTEILEDEVLGIGGMIVLPSNLEKNVSDAHGNNKFHNGDINPCYQEKEVKE